MDIKIQIHLTWKIQMNSTNLFQNMKSLTCLENHKQKQEAVLVIRGQLIAIAIAGNRYLD